MAKYNILEVDKIYKRKMLNASLAIPSTAHSYGTCIEYIKGWFLEKFPKKYFKSIHIDGRHVLDDMKNLTNVQLLKREKPALGIFTNIDFTFDREKVDSMMNGIDMYVKRSKYEDSFYKDRSKDVYLGMGMKVMLVNFNFKLKLSTSAQQMDMYDYMKMAFRVGYTQGLYASLDFHIPYDLMKQLALDSGFCIDKRGKIVDTMEFLAFINKNSQLPILYKYRCMNGNDEFFIRMNDLYIHINNSDISLDGGERQGHLMTNYTIEMTTQIRFPAPKFYLYYSEHIHDNIITKEEIDTNIVVYSAKMTEIPPIDEHQWNLYLTTDFEEDDKSKPLTIDFTELFKGTKLGKVIEYTNSIFISPFTFMNIKIYNTGVECEYTMDWNTCTLTTKENVKDIISNIAIYVDLNYMNNVLANLEQMYENRSN